MSYKLYGDSVIRCTGLTASGSAIGFTGSFSSGVTSFAKKTKTEKENQVIILLTDGESNDGEISVAEAVRLAKNEGIKIYTVGIGAPQADLIKTFLNIQNSGLDEQTLKELAAETKGRYFKVTNLKQLINVYQKIDELEEQDFEDRVTYEKKELYDMPLLIAFVFAFSALFLQSLAGRLK